MPSGAKKRKAAKKKKLQQTTHSHGEDVKNFDGKESDGGELSSPASRDDSGHSFAKGEEVELGKREEGLSGQVVVPESDSGDKQEVDGGVQVEWELKLEDDCKNKNISIESAKEARGGGSSSSGSSSSSSDDESRDVEDNTAVVETGLVVDTIEPVVTGQVEESVRLVETLAEVVSQVIEKVEVDESDDKVIETGSSVKLDDSLSSIVNQVSDSILGRETDRVAEALQVVDLAVPTESSPEVVCKVDDAVQNGETLNGVVETAPLVKSEKDASMEVTVVTESALTENHNTSCAVELDMPEVGEKKILTFDKSNGVSSQLVDSGLENKELATLEKSVAFLDAEDSAPEVQEDKLELSYNSFVGNTSNGAVPVPDYQNPEYSSNQLPVASTSQAVQKASVKSCCGLFELFTSSDR